MSAHSSTSSQILPENTLPDSVIMFSTADWNAPYWTNKQHIAQRLARRGVKVLYIESPGLRPPRASVRDLRRIIARLQRALRPVTTVDDNLDVFAPITLPFGHNKSWVRRLNGWLQARVLKAWIVGSGRTEPVIWTYHPYVDAAIESIDYSRLVYHCVDDIAAQPGVDATAFQEAEAQLLARADRVFTTSQQLQQHCAAIAGDRSVYERNVADLDHFGLARTLQPEPDDLAGIPHPRIAYIGVLSDFKLDLELIEQVATARPDQHWVFIGEEPEGASSRVIARLMTLPNTHFLGYRPYQALPHYLSAMDVAALPVLTHGYMASVFPMKLYEYLASGCPIVATPLSSLDDVRDMIHIAPDAAAWAAAIDRVFADPPACIPLDDPRLSEFSWDRRLDRMLALISDAVPRHLETKI